MMSWLRKYEGSRLAIAGLVVAAILFVAINVLANVVLRGAQADLTESNLYSVSDGTRRMLSAMDEPVQLRLYFSHNLGAAAPQFAAYYARVRDLLQRYVALSNGKISLELLEPEPFSDAEDRAVADGLQGVPLSQAGDVGYFGLAGSNTLDGRDGLPFFNLERESFLEYDLTKLINGLANPDRPVLGLMSALPLNDPRSAQAGAPAPRMLYNQIRDFFTVEELDAQLPAIPEKVKTLMVVDLQRLSPEALREVDRFVHAGGPALVFADALVESAGGMPGTEAGAPREDIDKLLAAWGVKLVPDKVAGDIDAARRVSTGERGTIADYLAWMTLGRANFDTGDPIMANIERLNIATSGILEPVDGSGLQVTPLVSTGPRSMAIPIGDVRAMPDIPALLRKFKSGDKPLMLAARITGPAPRAFSEAPAPEGVDKSTTPQSTDKPATPDASAPAPDATASAAGEKKPITVIVVADADMLYDRFWLQTSDFFGQRVQMPVASNADFVINALENLSDARALIGLRGRGTSYRPFTLVEDMRRDAEILYRAKEQQLRQRLTEIQGDLEKIQQRGGGDAMLTTEDKASIERFRSEMLTVRKELRNVQHALRSDIERLEERVKFINIAAVPVVLCCVGGGLALFRRGTRSRAKRQSQRG